MTMKARKLKDISVSSEVRASTSSHTTASEGTPEAARSARSAASEMEESMVSTAIEPSTGISRSRRSLRITLASSRATSHMSTSPSGLRAASGRRITLRTDSEGTSSSMARSAFSRGATILRWITLGQPPPLLG